MLEKRGQSIPYSQLGQRLKAIRLRVNETLAEASEAVEIDVQQLSGFEIGQSRPSEEILLLLLSHFGVKDDEAVGLWELAGYQMGKISSAHMASGKSAHAQTQNTDHIIYSDIVDIMVNNYGVVMNFMQNHGHDHQPTVVTKIGMSREHAKSVLQILQATLSQTEKKSPMVSDQILSPENPQEEPTQN